MAYASVMERTGSGSKEAACVRMSVRRFDGSTQCFIERPDVVIQETCLSLWVDGALCCETTCSPWDVEELVVGVLFMRGAIDCAEDIRRLEVDLEKGVASVFLAPPRAGEGAAGDRRASAARCAPDAAAPVTTLSPSEVNERIQLLEDRSLLFKRTGGVHSAVLADERGVLAWLEDIGRHSALDKLAGWCLLHKVDVADKILLFTGRVPREIVVKAVRLGCPIVLSPGAPTDLSIRLAERGGITLVGFGKGGSFNVYSHPERIVA